MGNGEGKWEGPLDVTDVHADPDLREALDRTRRTNLKRSASADLAFQHAPAYGCRLSALQHFSFDRPRHLAPSRGRTSEGCAPERRA